MSAKRTLEIAYDGTRRIVSIDMSNPHSAALDLAIAIEPLINAVAKFFGTATQGNGSAQFVIGGGFLSIVTQIIGDAKTLQVLAGLTKQAELRAASGDDSDATKSGADYITGAINIDGSDPAKTAESLMTALRPVFRKLSDAYSGRDTEVFWHCVVTYLSAWVFSVTGAVFAVQAMEDAAALCREQSSSAYHGRTN